jgi:hypothetical protein
VVGSSRDGTSGFAGVNDCHCALAAVQKVVRPLRTAVPLQPYPLDGRSRVRIRDPVFDELGFPTDPDNLYTQTVGQMLHAADKLNLQHRVRIILAQPKNEVMVHFPVRMNDGHHKLFKGYRIQHNNALGPTRAASASTRTCTSTT